MGQIRRVGRTAVERPGKPHTATIFEKIPGGFSRIAQSEGGSEIEALVLDHACVS